MVTEMTYLDDIGIMLQFGCNKINLNLLKDVLFKYLDNFVVVYLDDSHL